MSRRPSIICPKCKRRVGLFANGVLRPHKVIYDTGTRSAVGLPIASSVALGDWYDGPKMESRVEDAEVQK